MNQGRQVFVVLRGQLHRSTTTATATNTIETVAIVSVLTIRK
jgi:hypothetical protein